MLLLSTVMVFITLGVVISISLVHITQDGGYKGIVVRIDSNVREEKCNNIIRNIKVSFISDYAYCIYFFFPAIY